MKKFLSVLFLINFSYSQDICKVNNGILYSVENGNNYTYQVCKFSESMYCSYKSLIRQTCPIGGVNISKYKSDEEIYCGIHGGIIVNTDFTQMCKLPTGRYLPTIKYYNENEIYG